MIANDGGPAFPLPGRHGLALDPDDGVISEGGYLATAGMSLRDYFAAAALTSRLSATAYEEFNEFAVAKWSYEIADAMLAERDKSKEVE